MTIEEFLRELSQPIHIVGGSPLFTGPWPCPFISVNAKHAVPEACAAAINAGKQDAKRAHGWEFVLQPNNTGSKPHHPRAMIANRNYWQKYDLRGRQPTTYFALVAICQQVGVAVDLWGICGWASRFHYGDLEMHYLKKMSGVVVHDPRPQW